MNSRNLHTIRRSILITVLLGTTTIFAQNSAVEAALREPVLKDGALSSFNAINLLVRHADEAADKSWATLKTLAALKSHQEYLRKEWMACFGGFPERVPLNAKVVATVPREGYTIEKIIFESQPGLFVTAHLFLPDAKRFKPPYAAALISCGHSSDGKAEKFYQRGAVMGALSGLAILIYDPIDQGERQQLNIPKPPRGVHGHNVTGVSAMLLGWNTARFRIWDGIRCMDYLETRPEINHKSFGVMGNSGGGTLSSYIMAIDDRIGAGSPACYITSLRAVCEKIGPQDAEQNFFGQLKFGLNHAGYVLARAPSPVCLNFSHKDFFDFKGSLETYAVAEELFQRMGWSERLAMIDVPGPHGWKEGARQGSMQWMHRWLNGDTSAMPLNIEWLRELCANFDEKSVDIGLQNPEAFVTPNGFVHELPGARSVYDIMRSELDAIEKARVPLTKANRATIVRKAANIPPLSTLQAKVSEVAKRQHEGLSELRQTFALPNGITLPTVTLTPSSPTGAPVLLVADGGKSNAVASATALVAQGHPVMVADLTATGEIGASKHRFYGSKFPDEGIAVMLYLLGESLVGKRSEDLLICAQALSKAHNNQPVILQATGVLCVPAAHAYAVEPTLFSQLKLENQPISWSETIRKADRSSFSNTLQNGLRHYDWPQLAQPL